MSGSVGTYKGLPDGYVDPYRSPAEMPTIETPKKRSIMKAHWLPLFVGTLYVGAIGFVVGESCGRARGHQEEKMEQKAMAPPPTCPTNDFVIYPDDRVPEERAKGFTCPAPGQILEVVKVPERPSYFRCSCPKTP
jgi:hypothetical protein